jgi:uncharacterized protein (TIGR02118 family)
MIKMVVTVYRKPGMSWEEFETRWRDVHGELVKSLATAMGFRKYVQSHFQPSPDIESFAAIRGWLAPAEGLAELYWDSVEQMRQALSSPEGQAASQVLAKDEAEFVDMTRISAFLSVEHVVFDHT